jgi:hypothetical protein
MSNDNKLENLEFFESFLDPTDPIDNEDLSFDASKNIAPDILNGEELEEEDLEDPAPALNTKKDTTTTVDPLENEEEEEEEEILTDDDDDDSDNPFEVFANGLIQAGILDVEEKENVEWNEQSFISAFQETVDNKMWEKLEELATETYGEAGVKLIEDVFINKVPVQEYLRMFANEQVVENVDLSDEGNQERVVRLYLAKTGMDEDSIEDQLAYMRDNNRLDAYAEKYHDKLLGKLQEEREKLSQESEVRMNMIRQKETEREESYAQVLEESIKTGEIEGYPINDTDAQDLYSFVLDKPHILPNGQRISEFEYRLATMRQEDPKKFLAVARLVQKDLDLTPIKKKAVSEETNQIFKGLKTKTKTSTKSSKNQDLFAKYFK